MDWQEINKKRAIITFWLFPLILSVLYWFFSPLVPEGGLIFLFRLFEIAVYWSNRVDLVLYFTLPGPTYIAVSFVGCVVPLVNSVIFLVYTEKLRNKAIMPAAALIILLSTVALLMLHVAIPEQGVIAAAAIVPIVFLQCVFINMQKEENVKVVVLSTYWCTFFSVLIGDILVRYTDDLSILTITGGATFLDGLWLLPFQLAFVAFLIMND